MICRRLGLVLAAAAIPWGAASGQDRTRTVDIPASAYGPTWTGFYVGLGFGGGALVNRTYTSGSNTVAFGTDGAGGQGMLASIYGGVDYQILPRALIGVLAEGTYSNIESSASVQVGGGSATISSHANLSWSALVRAGILASPSTLLYLLGGYTGQNLNTSGTAILGGNLATFSRNDVFSGWTIGTGFETRLRGGWSTKLEYRYSQFETRTLPGTALTIQPSIHAVRLGLSYKFGGFGDDRHDDALPPEAHVNWTGAYIGAAGGASALIDRLGASFGGATATTTGGGQNLLGSAFGGFDFQVDERAVIGLLGDVTWTGPQSFAALSAGAAGATITSRSNMSLSAMARLGFLATPSTLLYAAGGYSGAFITTSATATTGTGISSLYRDDYVNGWTVGPGIETIIFGGWTTRLEYRYAQYEQKSFNGLSVQPSLHTVRAGLSYKFGPGK